MVISSTCLLALRDLRVWVCSHSVSPCGDVGFFFLNVQDLKISRGHVLA